MIGHPKLCHLPSNSQGSHQSRHPGRPWSERRGFPLPNHFPIFPAVPLHPPIGSPADITSKHLLHWNWWILVDWAPCLVINSGSLQWFVEWFGDSKFWECLKRLLYSIQGLLKRLLELCPGSSLVYLLHAPAKRVRSSLFFRCQEKGSIITSAHVASVMELWWILAIVLP